MKKTLIIVLAILCICTGIGMGYMLYHNRALKRMLCEVPSKTQLKLNEQSARLKQAREDTQRKVEEHRAALVAMRESAVSEWKVKESQLRDKAKPLFQEKEYVQHWRNQEAHLMLFNLFKLQEGVPNRVSGAIGHYLESFTVSDTSLRFDYHNTTKGNIKPDFTIDLFDSDGRHIDRLHIQWLFNKIAPEAYRSEVKTFSRGRSTPCYYTIQ